MSYACAALGHSSDICESCKRQGFAASVEVCIHYMCFDMCFAEDIDVKARDGLAKINPPIRHTVVCEKF